MAGMEIDFPTRHIVKKYAGDDGGHDGDGVDGDYGWRWRTG